MHSPRYKINSLFNRQLIKDVLYVRDAVYWTLILTYGKYIRCYLGSNILWATVVGASLNNKVKYTIGNLRLLIF